MFNQDFLKSLTILYVEDEDLAREKLAKVLKRFFKNVIVASDGEEGYKTFQKEMLTQNIDLILSDINMPKMNGIEMLEKIRETNKEIPIIYTTARTESEYLLRAIELNANHYIVKPIDIEDTIKKVEEVCEKKYFQELIKQKNIELEQYSDILDNVAGVFKLNTNKEISFVNNLLLENFNESQDRVLNKEISSFFSKDVSSSLIDDIWALVKKGSTWHGNLKFRDSNNGFFYLNTTIFQIINDEGFEYVGIGFISTEEVEEKREFHKKVIENIKSNSFKNLESNNKLKESLLLIEKMKTAITELENRVKTKTDKIAVLRGQVSNFEKELQTSNSKLEKILSVKNKEVEDLKNLIEKLRKERITTTDQINTLRRQLDEAYKEIDNKEDILKRKDDRIESLNDLISHRESQLKKLNPDIEL